MCICVDSVCVEESWWEDGLNRCSKIAIMRNIEIKMAVATNPKEMAFMDEPKLFHGPSLSRDSLLLYTLFHGIGFALPLFNSFIPFLSSSVNKQ